MKYKPPAFCVDGLLWVFRPSILHALNLSPSTIPEEYLCSDEQIFGLLTSLNTKKASGADGVTAQMLKATDTSIAKGITKLSTSL